MAWIKLSLLMTLMTILIAIERVKGHSWLINPPQRDAYPKRDVKDQMANQNDHNGCKYSREYGNEMTYKQGGDWSMAIVSRGKELCLQWASNGHFNDPRRGTVDFYLTQAVSGGAVTEDSKGKETQNSFFSNPIALDVDYANFKGIRVMIPKDTPLGVNTVQFRWYYCGSTYLFSGCSDIYVVEEDDPSGHKYGLPVGFSGVYGNCKAELPPIPTDPPEVAQGFCEFNDKDPDLGQTIKYTQSCSLDLNIVLSNPVLGSFYIKDISANVVEDPFTCKSTAIPSSPDDHCTTQMKLVLKNTVYSGQGNKTVELENIEFSRVCIP